MPGVNIGVIAEQAQVATSTIRYYERIGLLPPPKRVSGRRQYDSSILKKLRVIQAGSTSRFDAGRNSNALARLSRGHATCRTLAEVVDCEAD